MTLRFNSHRSASRRFERPGREFSDRKADLAYGDFLTALAEPLAPNELAGGTGGQFPGAGAAPTPSRCRRWRLALPGGIDQLRIAYFGVQRHSPADASMRAAAQAVAAIRAVLFQSGAAAIESSEVLAGHDMTGTWVQSAYWVDPDSAAARLASLDLSAIYDSLGPWRDSVGIWSEQFTTSTASLATRYTGSEPVCHRHGLARWPRATVVPDTTAPGAAEPPAPRVDDEAAAGLVTARGTEPIVPSGYGQHLSGRNPHPLVHVRCGHDGSDCGELEAGLRERGLQILIDLGLQHLWRQPVETGTSGLRQLVQVDDDAGHLADVGFAGFFSSAPDLGRWMTEYDAHMADFRRLLDQEGLIERHQRLRTYREISTIAAGAADFEYVNCGPRTGVIRFTDLQRRRLSLRPDLR